MLDLFPSPSTCTVEFPGVGEVEADWMLLTDAFIGVAVLLLFPIPLLPLGDCPVIPENIPALPPGNWKLFRAVAALFINNCGLIPIKSELAYGKDPKDDGRGKPL